jgi:hypothetical protein
MVVSGQHYAPPLAPIFLSYFHALLVFIILLEVFETFLCKLLVSDVKLASPLDVHLTQIPFAKF